MLSSFPQKRESLFNCTKTQIPAFAGMTVVNIPFNINKIRFLYHLGFLA
jgi:hypothetical protein